MRPLLSLLAGLFVGAAVLLGPGAALGSQHLSPSELLRDGNMDGKPDRDGQSAMLVGPTMRAALLSDLDRIQEEVEKAQAAGDEGRVADLTQSYERSQAMLPRLINQREDGSVCFPVTESSSQARSVLVCSKSISSDAVMSLDDGRVARIQGVLNGQVFTGESLHAPVRALAGRFLVLLALALAAFGMVLGFLAGRRLDPTLERWTRWASLAFSWTLVAANLLMVEALLARDFSVAYVDQVGSHEVPTWLAIVSLWSSLEGSILFWGLIFALFTLVFTHTTAKRPEHRPFAAYTLGATLAVGMFFAFLIAGPADPFGPSAWPHGVKALHTGPNPLLQNHLLMIVHPPALYLGYVGMVIPFAMGIAAMLRGQLGAGWMRPIRLWMLVPWGALTVGIVLGGWWAYEVLGWGGYWAWDPVENASLLPWLTASAFLHSAMIMERRGTLKTWTMVLLLSTFALTILGTFMTRSGVFNSVHAFAKGSVGPTFLVFLAIVLVVSVLLLGFRSHLLEADGDLGSLLSRDAAFIGNNLLFVAVTLTVLIGTTFPLIKEALTGEQISVGEPYFNAMVVPMSIGIVFLMGVGPALPWGRASVPEAVSRLRGPLAIAAGVTLAAVLMGARDFLPALTIFVSAFASWVAVRDMWEPISAIHRRQGGSLGAAVARAFRRGRRRYAGQIVHLGVALMAVAIAISSVYQLQTEAVVNRGQTMQIGDYELRFEGVRHTQEPHRQIVAAEMSVKHLGNPIGRLAPAMIRYPSQTVGTPAVHSRFDEDLYLSAMQIDDEGQFVGMRAYVNPMVYWVWIAAGVMTIGCIIALWPAGRRRQDTESA